MGKIKLIIFDLDGTLIDAYRAIEKSFNHVMRALGLKTQTPETIRRMVGWGDMNLIKPYLDPADLKHGLRLYRQHHKSSLLKYARLYPAARSLLKDLKMRGYQLAVASNRPSRFSRILLKHLKIRAFFDYVLCADQAGHPKPHPEMLNRIVQKLCFKKTQALYVGDMAIDACAGRAAGIKTVIISGGSSSRAEIKKEKPFKVIAALGDLKKLL